jgi:Tol biopolymer transport system component
MEDRHLGLWVMFPEGGKSLPLAVTGNSHNEGAVWSPDGTRIAFTSTRAGSFDIWIMDVDMAAIKQALQKVNKEED